MCSGRPVIDDLLNGYPLDGQWNGYVNNNDRVLLKVCSLILLLFFSVCLGLIVFTIAHIKRTMLVSNFSLICHGLNHLLNHELKLGSINIRN